MATLQWHVLDDNETTFSAGFANYGLISGSLRYRNANNNNSDSSDPLVKPTSGFFASYEKFTAIYISVAPGTEVNTPRFGLNIYFDDTDGSATPQSGYTGIYFYLQFTQTFRNGGPDGDGDWDAGNNNKTGGYRQAYYDSAWSGDTPNDGNIHSSAGTPMSYRDGSAVEGSNWGSALPAWVTATHSGTPYWNSLASPNPVHFYTVIEIDTNSTGGTKDDFQLVFRYDEI